MAKTLRLQGDVQGHAGQALTYSIYSDLGTGITSEDVHATLADGLTFEWDSGDVMETYAPIMSSTCSMRFTLDHDDEINAFVEMVRGTEADTYIVVEQANGWRWMGSLLPDEAAVEITDGFTEVSMTFTDGLSLLKGIDFKVDAGDIFTRTDESAGAPYQPGRTGLGLVWTILNKIPWMQEVSWPVGTNAISEIPGIGTSAIGAYKCNLPHVGLNPAAFSKETKNPRRGRQMPKPSSFVNCYDVLGDICETFGYRLSWNGEGWGFTSFLVAKDFAGSGPLETTFLHSDLLADGSGRLNGVLGLRPWQYDLDASYSMEEGATRVFGQKYSGARAVHVEAGSNQLWTRRDNAVMGEDQNFQDLVPGIMRQQDALVEFESESDINLRYQGYFDLKGGNDAKNAAGHKPCAVIKLKLGTTSHTADPYLLSSEMLNQGYDTSITGGAAASSMRCWANATLPDATWVNESAVQTKSDGLPDPYDTPGVLYIPLTWSGDSFNPNAPSVDHGADGTFYGGLHTSLKNGETNVLKYDKWGQLHFDVSLPTIVTPGVDLEGYEMEVGLAFFGAGAAASGMWSGESVEVLNTVYARDSETFVHTLDSACETLYNNYIDKYVLHRIRFNKGDGTGDADRIYFEEVDNGATDALEFAEVRIASGLQDGVSAQGPKFINYHTANWPTESWSFDTDWLSYSGLPTTNPTTKENLELLADEWLYVNGSGVEALVAKFAPNYLSSSSMPTGADIFGTSCVTTGSLTSYYVPTRFTWSSISGLSFEGWQAARDETLTPFRSAEDSTEEPSNVSIFIKDTAAGLGGKNKSTSDTEVLAGINKTAQDDSIAEVAGAVTLADTMTQSTAWEVHGPSGTRGIGSPYLYKINGDLTPPGAGEVTSNLHFVGVDNNGKINSPLKTGLSDFDLTRSAGGTDWTTVDGGLTVNTWLDTTGASNGQALAYNSTSGDVEWTTISGGGGGATDLDSLTDVTLTSSVTGDMLVNIAGTFRNSSAASVASTLAANTDLGDLSNVDNTAATSGQALVWNGTEWEPAALDIPAGLTDLNDVDIPSVSGNDILSYNLSTTQWEAESPSIMAGSIDLDDLNNVASGGSAGQFLRHNGISWAPGTVATPTLDEVTTAGATTTNNVSFGDTGTEELTATTLTTGDPINGFIEYPTTDGTSGQAIVTDGAGNLTFGTVSATTPTLSDVTSAGATTTDDIEVGELTTTGGALIDGAGSSAYLSSLVVKGGASSVFLQHWEDSTGALKAYMFPTGNLVTAGSVTTPQIGVTSQYIMPLVAGTTGQVITFPASGSTLTWEDQAGGGNPIYNFEGQRYNSVTTTTDLFYWLPGSSTYGFEFYDGNELSTLSTSNTWNRFKKMSHRIPETGTYDLDFSVDVSMSASSGGTSNESDYNGDDIEVYAYKITKGTGGNCTITQIGTTQTNTQHATDTAEGTESTWSVSGESLTASDRILVCLKGTQQLTGTAYCHWSYDVIAEKTA